jgi:hypothetical protein
VAIFTQHPENVTAVSPPNPLVISARVADFVEEPQEDNTEQDVFTAGELQVALTFAGMSHGDAFILSRAAVECESPAMRGGHSVGALAHARGDGGLAHGPFQIRIDAHHDLHAIYDLDSKEGASLAAVKVWKMQGLSAWSCVREGEQWTQK